MLWLDVVRHHDLEIAKGVVAADKLVKVGERAKAIEAAAGHRALRPGSRPGLHVPS